jgi:hypothetical protein
MMDRSRASFIVAGVLAVTGLGVALIFTVVSVMTHDPADAAAAGPGSAPTWVLLGQAGGVALLVLGLLALLVLLAVRLLRGSRGTGAPSYDGEHHVEAHYQHLGTPPPGSR